MYTRLPTTDTHVYTVTGYLILKTSNWKRRAVTVTVSKQVN